MKKHFKPSILFILCVATFPSFVNAAGPILVDDAYVRDKGAVITGDFEGTLTQPAISITTKQPITIVNSTVKGPGDLIYAQDSDLYVLNTTAIGTNPNVAGTRKGRFIRVEKLVNLLVSNCRIENVGYGIYVNRYTGNYTSRQTIRIHNNQFINIDARPSDGNNGYRKTGNGATHAILLNAQYSVPYVEISWNEMINRPYVSDCSDIINMYNSSGTSNSHILIHDNYAQGAYSITPGEERYSGGGIIVDGQANNTLQNASGFIDIYNNHVVSTSNYGVSIAAGHDNRAFNNRVISSGFLDNGVFHAMPFGNGLNNYNNYNQPATIFFNNYAYNNFLGLIRPDSNGKPMRSDMYLPAQSDKGNNVSFTPNNVSNPTLADERAELALWKKRSGFFKQIIGRLPKDIKVKDRRYFQAG